MIFKAFKAAAKAFASEVKSSTIDNAKSYLEKQGYTVHYQTTKKAK